MKRQTKLTQQEQEHELENTLIVISGDHGIPGFPHGKCNLYDFGTGVCLAIAGPGVRGGRVVDDFVNLTDLAPTFLETGGLAVPEVMTGRACGRSSSPIGRAWWTRSGPLS